MKLFYQFMAFMSNYSMAIAKDRRDRVDAEIMYGDPRDFDMLHKRRDKINVEVETHRRDADNWERFLLNKQMEGS